MTSGQGQKGSSAEATKGKDRIAVEGPLNPNRRSGWLGLMTLLLVAGATWIALSKVPAEEMAARTDPPAIPHKGFTLLNFLHFITSYPSYNKYALSPS